MSFRKITSLAAAFLCMAAISGLAADPGLKRLPAQMPLAQLVAQGVVPATNRLQLAIGLPLHHQDQLDELIGQLYDPHSANYHQFLTPEEFTARFGPTEQEYEAVVQFAEAHGLAVVGRYGNRAVLDVAGSVGDIDRAFKTTLRIYQHPTEPRHFFAPDTAPSVPTNLPAADLWGLSDYARPKPQLVKAAAVPATPLNYNGSGPGGTYEGADFRNAYIPGSGLTGAGQTVALVEMNGYYPNDISNYEAQCGYSNVPMQNVLVDGFSGTPSGDDDSVAEVSLDIELTVSMAPGLTKVVVYEGASPYDVFNSIATSNIAKQVSCSWTWSVGPTTPWLSESGSTLDSILKEMVAQGQAFFQAAGDYDAYTGPQALNATNGPIPVDSIYVTSVGGTSLTMNGPGVSWSSETVWNWGNSIGTSGGISPNYKIPSWQANVNMSSNNGSSTQRNIPDVAMTADAINVIYGNGNSGTFGGTSCAAPLWAGFCALVNQQSVGTRPGKSVAGFLNPALYAIGTGTNYNACFNDITTGDDIGTNTVELYAATPGYDLCTGWGTPNGTNLVNALAPLDLPFFISQPAGQSVRSGTNVTISATVSGAQPLDFHWIFDGTNLSDGGNISGSDGNILSIAAATTANAGNYRLVVTNAYGSTTSTVVSLTVDLLPAGGTLASSENPSGFNDPVNFTAAVVPTYATGTIQFYINGTAFDLETLMAAQAVSTNISSLPRGTNLIAAVYSGDANDLPFTNQIFQIVTNHPPTAVPAFFTRAAGAALDIPVTNLAADWSDVDGDTVSLADISVSTNGVTVTDDSGVLSYYDPNNVADQFTCTITDGFGGTNYQTVNITVIFPRISVAPTNNAGGITLDLTGEPGQTYILEATTNLVSPVIWLPLATNTLGTNGLWQFNDPQSPNFTQRFFQLEFSQ